MPRKIVQALRKVSNFGALLSLLVVMRPEGGSPWALVPGLPGTKQCACLIVLCDLQRLGLVAWVPFLL